MCDEGTGGKRKRWRGEKEGLREKGKGEKEEIGEERKKVRMKD